MVSVAFYEENETQLGEKANIFRAFFIQNGKLKSVHRRFNLLPIHAHASSKNWASDIIYTSYKKKRSFFKQKGTFWRESDQRPLTTGVDPRVVSEGQDAYVVFLDLDPDQNLRHKYRVVHLPSNETTYYESVPNLPLGKNWQPFIRDGRLFVLHGFAPCAVFELKPNGVAELVFANDQGFSTPVSHDNYSIYRGGCNAIQGVDGKFYGYGHANYDCYLHSIFPWSLDSTNKVVCEDVFAFKALTDKGYHIHDVTSFFQYEESLYMGIALSERDWFHTQRFADILLQTPLNGRPVSEVWNDPDAWNIDDEDISQLSAVKTYFPSDSWTDIDCTTPFATCKSNGDPGQVYELLEPLEINSVLGSTLEISYRAETGDENIAFVRLSKHKDNKLSGPADFYDLNGTSGSVCTIKIPLPPLCHRKSIKMNILSTGGVIEILNIRLKENGISMSLSKR